MAFSTKVNQDDYELDGVQCHHERSGRRCHAQSLDAGLYCAKHITTVQAHRKERSIRYGAAAFRIGPGFFKNFSEGVDDPDILDSTAEISLIQAATAQIAESADPSDPAAMMTIIRAAAETTKAQERALALMIEKAAVLTHVDAKARAIASAEAINKIVTDPFQRQALLEEFARIWDDLPTDYEDRSRKLETAVALAPPAYANRDYVDVEADYSP